MEDYGRLQLALKERDTSKHFNNFNTDMGLIIDRTRLQALNEDYKVIIKRYSKYVLYCHFYYKKM